jgi:predicted TIM-barrel fold metal-dependent hydrolase
VRRGLLLLLTLLACGCHRASAEHYRKIDVHTHLMGPQGVANAIRIFDHYGIDMAVNLSGEVPGQGLEENLALAKQYPGRLVVFTNVDWSEPQRGPGYGQRLAAEVERAHQLGAKGLKIYKALGLAVIDYQHRLIPVDDPELDPMFDKAGELGMPVAIHTGDPVAFWEPVTPANERWDELSVHPHWAYYGKRVPSWEQLFEQLERRIARSPKTTFISVHFGNAPEYLERVAQLLEKYPNMYVDTAARIPEIGRANPQKMHDMFTRFQDRIMFGTDLGVGARPEELMLGSTGANTPTEADIDRFYFSTWRYFETWEKGFPHPTPIQGNWTIDGIGLDPTVLRKVYGGNAARLLGL